MSILALVAKKDEMITITVEGEDAPSTMNDLLKAFKNHFNE